ncbi:SEC-C domain-containing protein [Chlorobium sp. KB01]|uniref:SEC-C domain-containing protein n=1 Tax=Chlorobium sp. KB01 TaxID=1917528 RepID=UPI0009765193|nr:SEC-C domain-containing protein [Chlorobium sp. KB01]
MVEGNVYHTIPCSCGSGKSFEECCYREELHHASLPERGIREALSTSFQGGEFTSLEEAQAFMQELMVTNNRTSLSEFAGLSPEQMHRFLAFPFGSNNLATFASVLPFEPDSPVTSVFKALAEAIGEKGLKATVAGNLPQKVVRDIAIALTGRDTHGPENLGWRLNREEEYPELHITRFTAELAGLVRKFKGKFMLTKKCRTVQKNEGLAGIWPVLFRAYVEKFNWHDRGPDELPFIQDSFLFTLYLLNKYGAQERSGDFYSRIFVEAFPALLNEVSPKSYCSAIDSLSTVYLNRAMSYFAEFFGLAIVAVDYKRSGAFSASNYRITARPLLQAAVQFHIPEA